MAEPLHEQISAALQARLRTIAADNGTSYWYTPDRVFRVLEFQGSDLDDSFEHLLFLRPDDDQISEGTTGTIEGEANFTVLIAKKDTRGAKAAQSEESDGSPIAATVISRCVADIRRVLLSEVTLGGLAWNVMGGECTADYSWPVEGWLCATVTFGVQYDYPKAN